MVKILIKLELEILIIKRHRHICIMEIVCEEVEHYLHTDDDGTALVQFM
jgi:hypothetical protein